MTATSKIPEADPQVEQQVAELLADPVAYFERARQKSLLEARATVDRRVSEILAEQKRTRVSFGRRILRRLGIGRPETAS